MDIISLALSKHYTDETVAEFGGVKGAPCTIKSIVHQDGQNTVTFEWKNSAGETRESVMVVNDGTPIYVWERGNTYKYGDLVIYASCFYRCITPNSDVVFDSTKWNEIGSPDGNYDIVENSTLLPARFTAADRKMYYSIADGIFWLWDGTRWTKALGTAAQKDSTNVVENSTDLVESSAVYNALATKVNLTSVGVASGIASLNEHGKVPSSELPSYVDDVIEAYYKALDDRFYEESTFETLITPEAGKCWVDIPSNKSYRWTGSVYVRVDEGVQLGETADSAYAGNKGKKNADDIATLTQQIAQIEEEYSNVTPTVQSGTKIAEIKTNGTTVDLLIPQQSGGHQILTSTGSIMPQRSKLKFLNSDLTDDAANDTTIVSPRGGGAVIKIGDVEGASATSTPGTASVVLKWTDPEDVVVSGATLAEWAGTKVIRKAGSAPTSVSDGTEVLDSTTKNAYSSTGYTDSGLTYGTTYYYRFFPYTTQGAVTDGSSVNATPDRASVAVPTFTATMTYTGSQQTATFTGYDSTKMTVSGNTGTNAGSYTAKFNVKADYKWSDGTREEKSVSWSIDKKSVTCPTLSGTYTYTGSAQSVTISSYSASEVTVGGDTSATNAGTYTVTFDLADTDNYIWSDNTTAQKSATWTIGKANGAVTLSSSSVTLNSSYTSRTVTASGATGTLSVSSSNTSVATASVNGTTITINSVNNTSGSATITVSVAASNNYNATSKTISVTANFFNFKIFAVHYSENNSDPDSCDYPQGYDNYGWTPMYVNLSTGAPVYNSWHPTGTNANKVAWLFPKSCMLKYDGTVDYYLNENDESKKANGTASDYNNTSYGGNCMMEWNQDSQAGAYIYWKILPDSDGKGWTFIVANQPKDKNGNADSDMKPWNHYNCDGNLAKHFYTPKYNGSNISSKIRSLSGQTCYVNENDSSENTKCRANNTTSKIIWDKEVCADSIFVGLMLCLFSKSLNTQAKYGYGYANGNSATIQTGTMDNKGLFYGESSGRSGVKVFGMENWWGNIWRRIRGLINASGTVKVKMTHGRQDGSTADDYNDTGSGYLSVGSIGGTTGGYISAMNITKYGLFPKTISGSSSTYYCDGVYFNNSQTNVAFVGGGRGAGLFTGTFACVMDSTASRTDSSMGASLSCKPLS